MKNNRADWSEVLALVLATVIFATVMLPLLHLTGIHALLVKLSVESSKIFAQAFHW